jgi:hypothetical protein
MAKSSLISWFEMHGNAVQGLAAIATALIALSALIGVKVQIDAAARAQQEQSARDIYREFLSLSISKPEFAEPDYCAIKGTPQDAAYRNYVDYLLYTSEQMLTLSPEWEGALADHLEAHDQYLCGVSDWSDYPENVSLLVARVRAKICPKTVKTCE